MGKLELREMSLKRMKIADLVFDPANLRKHPEKNLKIIKGSIVKYNQQKPILVDSKGVVMAGNGLLQMAIEAGLDEIWAVESDLEGVDKTGYAIVDNRSGETSTWEFDSLYKTLKDMEKDNYEIDVLGFDEMDFKDLFENDDDKNNLKGNLSEKFGVPPFSILNAREGSWQDRKRKWIELGIKSELGRV